MPVATIMPLKQLITSSMTTDLPTQIEMKHTADGRRGQATDAGSSLALEAETDVWPEQVSR